MSKDINDKVNVFIKDLDKPAWEGSSYKLRNDNEVVHSSYDTILEDIAKKYEPRAFKKLSKAVEDISFWYA